MRFRSQFKVNLERRKKETTQGFQQPKRVRAVYTIQHSPDIVSAETSLFRIIDKKNNDFKCRPVVLWEWRRFAEPKKRVPHKYNAPHQLRNPSINKRNVYTRIHCFVHVSVLVIEPVVTDSTAVASGSFLLHSKNSLCSLIQENF